MSLPAVCEGSLGLKPTPSPQWSLVKPLKSSSRLQGGGMDIYESTVTVISCTIRNNTADAVSRFPKILELLRNGPSPQWICHVWNLIGACLVWQGDVSSGNESNLLKPSSIAPLECYNTAEFVLPFAGWWDVNRREQHSHCHHLHN